VIASIKSISQDDVELTTGTIEKAYLVINDCDYGVSTCGSDVTSMLALAFRDAWGGELKPPDTGLYWSKPSEDHAYGEESHVFTSDALATNMENLLKARVDAAPPSKFAKSFVAAKSMYVTYGYQEKTMEGLNQLLSAEGMALEQGETYSTIVKVSSTTDKCYIDISNIGGSITRLDTSAGDRKFYPGTTYFITIYYGPDAGKTSGFMVYAQALTEEIATELTTRCISVEQARFAGVPVGADAWITAGTAATGPECGAMATDCKWRSGSYLHDCKVEDKDTMKCAEGALCIYPNNAECFCNLRGIHICYDCNARTALGLCIMCPDVDLGDNPVFYDGKCYSQCPPGTHEQDTLSRECVSD
jgi:hypothetical protein